MAGALIFGVIHLNPAQIPGAALFGLILGWLYWRSGTIWIPVARTCHEQPDRRGTRMAYRQYGPDTGGTLRRHMAGCSMCHTLGHTVRMAFQQTATASSRKTSNLLKDAERPTYPQGKLPFIIWLLSFHLLYIGRSSIRPTHRKPSPHSLLLYHLYYRHPQFHGKQPHHPYTFPLQSRHRLCILM